MNTQQEQIVENRIVALDTNWLDGEGLRPAAQNTVATALSVTGNYVGGCYTWPDYSPAWWYHYTAPERPIKLKLSEVEKLRAAARKDKALREILLKFTPRIEVEVDL